MDAAIGQKIKNLERSIQIRSKLSRVKSGRLVNFKSVVLTMKKNECHGNSRFMPHLASCKSQREVRGVTRPTSITNSSASAATLLRYKG